MFTSLTTPAQPIEQTEVMISSLMDTWILVAIDTVDMKRTRNLYVLKSRGMPHSDEVHPFRFTSRGIDLSPARPAKGPKRPAKRVAKRGARSAR
jgi:circadian clock protein KaiC